jgi:hypothetical protein
MAGGLPTDGKAELRINTSLHAVFEMNTVKIRSRKLDNCGWTRAVIQGSVRRLFIRSSAFLSVGITKRTHFVAWSLSPFGVSADTTTWTLGLTKVGLSEIGK